MRPRSIQLLLLLPLASGPGARASVPANAAGFGDHYVFNMDFLQDSIAGHDPATPLIKIKTVLSALPKLKGKSFAIRAINPRKEETLDFTAVANPVADALRRQGMAMAGSGSAPDFLFWVDYAARAQDAQYKFFCLVVTDPSIATLGKIHLVRSEARAAAKAHILFEAAAAAYEPESSDTIVAPRTIKAFFQSFPDEAGQVRLTELPAD